MFDMLGNIFRNLGSKPATRTEKREPIKNTRGQISGINIDDCIFCGICTKRCPSDAIVIDKAEKSWEIDQYKCIICGACTEACPKKCIKMEEQYKSSSYKKEKAKFIKNPDVSAAKDIKEDQK